MSRSSSTSSTSQDIRTNIRNTDIVGSTVLRGRSSINIQNSDADAVKAAAGATALAAQAAERSAIGTAEEARRIAEASLLAFRDLGGQNLALAADISGTNSALAKNIIGRAFDLASETSQDVSEKSTRNIVYAALGLIAVWAIWGRR